MAFVVDDLIIAATIAAAAGSIYQGKQAEDAQEEAFDKQSAQEEIRQRNQRVKTTREARVARARAQQAAANIGVSGSSLESGATGSIATQQASASAMLTGEENAAKGISSSLQQAADHQFAGATIKAAGSMFNTLAGSGMFKSQPQVDPNANPNQVKPMNTTKTPFVDPRKLNSNEMIS